MNLFGKRLLGGLDAEVAPYQYRGASRAKPKAAFMIARSTA
jgi:hypothetical protein